MKKFFAIIPVFLAAAFILFPGVAHAATNYNELITDTIFDNSNSMNAAQIDAFLNTFPSSCISTNNGFSAPDPIGYTPSGGFTYGGDISAGKVIYDASQAYGINPQVIITTLQKEQGLIVGDGGNVERNGTDCGALAISASMGYNCPDAQVLTSYSGFELYSHNGVPVTSVTNTCVEKASYVGFSRQVIIAAWQLTFDRHRSEGLNNWYINKPGWDNSDDLGFCYSGHDAAGGPYYLCPDQDSHANDPFVTHSGQYVIDGTVVTIANGATAALYNYTPHLHGQDLFENDFTGWFGPPVPVNLTGSPAAVSWGSSRIDVFSRGSDGTLWQKWFDTSGWRPWASLNVPISSTPTVSSWGSGRLDVFYVNGAGDLGHYWFDGTNWQGPEALGQPAPNITITGSPTAVSWGSGRIDVFVRGSDGALWQKWFNSTGGWRPWVHLDGNIASSPTASSWSANRLDIFANGPGGNLEHYWFDGTNWNGWESLGFPNIGLTTAIAPAAVSWGPSRVDVFSRGNDGAIWQEWFDSAGGWRPWNRLGGAITSAPAVSSWGTGRLDVFGDGNPGDLEHYWFDGTNWNGWESLSTPDN